jgi:hypothetical protein
MSDNVVCGLLGTLTPMPRVAPVIAQDTIFSLFSRADKFVG